MMKRALLVVILLTSCATPGLDRHQIVRSKLAGLDGADIHDVQAALCDSCEASRDMRRLKCRVYLEGCSGRFNRVRLAFDDAGRMASWWSD